MTWTNVEATANQYVTHSSETSQTIPWIDMSRFIHGSSEEKIATAIEFGRAFQELGFVAVTHIGISPATIDKAYAFAETFFHSAQEFKMTVHSPDGHYGYVPFGVEHAKYTDIIDLKEFYSTTGHTQPDHLWPEIAGFKQAMTRLYLELETCMKSCLQATAIYLGYTDVTKHTILSNLLGSGNGLMRMLHYPPINPTLSPPGAIRSAAHEDVSMMTVIPRATHPGLQVKNHQGDWIDVTVPDNAAIINAGDTLSYMTNGIIPSTTHRVINPPIHDYSSRYSIPFFGSLPFNTVMRVLDKCRGNTPKSALPKEITFGDFLSKRYRDIGIKK